MNRLYFFLIAVVCLPVAGIAQNDGGVKDGLRVIKPENRIVVDSILSESKLKRTGDQVFDTHPMPNLYRRDYAVSMPNAYRGDNCVDMPNLYQEKPTRFIIVDSIGTRIPDSVLIDKLEKQKSTLKKERHLKTWRP